MEATSCCLTPERHNSKKLYPATGKACKNETAVGTLITHFDLKHVLNAWGQDICENLGQSNDRIRVRGPI